MSYLRTSRAGARLRWAGRFGLIAALSLCLTPGVANAAKKKKKDTVKILNYNLYLGSDTDQARDVALIPRTDLFADEVGSILSNVNANDFTIRARTIAKRIKKNKADLVGLQEASLWKLEVPTDGGGPPRGTAATVVLIDYIDTLLDELNKKARTKKQCRQKGLNGDKCYRGYRLVGAQQQSDLEQPGDFDHNPGPDGKTFDVSNSASLGTAAPSRWLEGNDDTPEVNFGEPPAAQCADGRDNDGDGLIDFGPLSAPPFGNSESGADCQSLTDNDETAASSASGLPQDANFDSHLLSPNFNPAPGAPGFDGSLNGEDPAGVTDCPDTRPQPGPAGGGLFPFSGYDGDFDPVTAGSQVPVCMFHGIDGDLRVQDRDVVLARNGAGVKTRNVTGANFSPGSTLSFNVFGLPIYSTRGWVSADVSVRGKKFRLVNTHLEDEDSGTFREDQASELIAPGGPAATTPVVLVGDLNSDPSIAPGADPEADGLSNVAYNRLAAAGFRSLTGPGPTWGHGELLNDLGNLIDDSRIDHILTNSPSIRLRSSVLLDPRGGGLWASDHAGLLSRLKIPGGKKKK